MPAGPGRKGNPQEERKKHKKLCAAGRASDPGPPSFQDPLHLRCILLFFCYTSVCSFYYTSVCSFFTYSSALFKHTSALLRFQSLPPSVPAGFPFPLPFFFPSGRAPLSSTAFFFLTLLYSFRVLYSVPILIPFLILSYSFSGFSQFYCELTSKTLKSYQKLRDLCFRQVLLSFIKRTYYAARMRAERKLWRKYPFFSVRQRRYAI